MKRYTGTLHMTIGYPSADREGEYDFECEPEDFDDYIEGAMEDFRNDYLEVSYTEESEEDVEEEE